MKNIYFTCGPSQLYPTVKSHLKTALDNNLGSISHRGQQFQNIYKSAQTNLRKLLSIPLSHKIFFLSSSLESMERIIENCVEKQSFHFVNGAFSHKFYQFAKLLKKSPVKHEVDWGEGYLLNKIKIPKRTELICITQNETSTGASIPLQDINQIKQNHNVLVAVDIVSSAPYVKFDFSKIDLVFFSVQKGFGLPAGLSILIVSDRAIKKSNYLEKKGVNMGSYHSFSSLLEKGRIFQTPETPNVLSIYLLNQVCKDMLNKGITTIRKAIDENSKLVFDFFDQHPKYKPFVNNPVFRSRTTIEINVRGEANKILKKLKSSGIVVSSGYGKFKDNHIRIANFPAHSKDNFHKLINVIGYN